MASPDGSWENSPERGTSHPDEESLQDSVTQWDSTSQVSRSSRWTSGTSWRSRISRTSRSTSQVAPVKPSVQQQPLRWSRRRRCTSTLAAVQVRLESKKWLAELRIQRVQAEVAIINETKRPSYEPSWRLPWPRTEPSRRRTRRRMRRRRTRRRTRTRRSHLMTGAWSSTTASLTWGGSKWKMELVRTKSTVAWTNVISKLSITQPHQPRTSPLTGWKHLETPRNPSPSARGWPRRSETQGSWRQSRHPSRAPGSRPGPAVWRGTYGRHPSPPKDPRMTA